MRSKTNTEMNNTHTFKLTSGVECEVKEMTGLHQRLLTEQKKKKVGENLEIMLADLIVRVGSERTITPEFVRNMLASDRKKALTEIQQFTNDFDPIFKFIWHYESVEGGKKEHELEIDLSGGFPMTTLKVLQPDGTLIDADYKEYSEIQRNYYTILPKTKLKVRLSLLDGVGETKGLNTKLEERSSHTPIYMRFPCEMRETGNTETPISINLDKLPIKDIEHLRKLIKQVEGQVDTEIMFEHPEAAQKAANEKEVTIDVLGVTAFFFPSEAI